jgi:16S rRNA (uracil1498-N3)-methyltransferase
MAVSREDPGRRSSAPGRAGEAEPQAPRFFLSGAPGPPRLAPDELRHALGSRRLGRGAEILGLDGQGGIWRLRIAAARAGALELEPLGPPAREPAPGEPGAPLPWIEVAVAWPRKGRGEEMLGRLVQLGAAAITPLAARQGGAAEPPARPPERWRRIVREACKQCGRSWLPELGGARAPGAWAAERPGAAIALCDPRALLPLARWVAGLRAADGERDAARAAGTRARPIALVIGPEGGFDDDERAALAAAGATAVGVAPHVLRVETAAEAATAIAVHATASEGNGPASGADRARV